MPKKAATPAPTAAKSTPAPKAGGKSAAPASQEAEAPPAPAPVKKPSSNKAPVKAALKPKAERDKADIVDRPHAHASPMTAGD